MAQVPPRDKGRKSRLAGGAEFTPPQRGYLTKIDQEKIVREPGKLGIPVAVGMIAVKAEGRWRLVGRVGREYPATDSDIRKLEA